MNFTMNWSIAHKGKQQLVNQELSRYTVKQEGYHLYPIGIPVTICKTVESNPLGTAIIRELSWKDESTQIIYDMISLHTVN